ncbi:type I secretion system permease/ATPase [Rhizobiales bacterium RZME27]|jgi:ATP-binding cassette subfamily C protein LapB|uniref:Type I secretion system permease/ATPase n=1 Tax=Endobacterium cereale TaxID=2663029 RepID=A0A6A8A8T9_9HYPH|nr:type I secretion system permease/ATPase [Endobacterium cereale]MEB2848560.1 type I secretion system permease/ATPase [Endobacterium cereale]MQY46308.1 type I secretion system permease/ATPase [Endobacterium cereale]
MVQSVITAKIGGAEVPADAWVEVLGHLAQRLGIPHSKFAASYYAITEENVAPIQRIERLARRFGIEIRAVEPTATGINTRRLPMLIQFRDGAVALVTAVNGHRTTLIYGGDNGQWTTIPIADLKDSIAYLLIARDARDGKDARVDPFTARNQKSWFRTAVLPDIRPYWYVLLATLVANSLSLAGVIFSMQVYDRAVPAQSYSTLTVLFSGVILAIVFDFIMRQVRTGIIDVLGKRADIKVSDRVFGHALEVKSQARPKATGTFISQLRELEQVRELFTSTTVAAVADIPFFLIFLVVFWYIGGALAIIPAIALFLMVLPGLLAQPKLKSMANLAMRESSLRNAMLVESVQGGEDIKALQAEKIFRQRWNSYNSATAEANMRLRALTGTLSSWSHAIQTAVFAVIVFCGAPMVMAGDMTTGALVACSILGSRMMGPMGQVTGVLSRYQHAKIGMQGLNSIMELPTDHPQAERRISVTGLAGHYQFRSATFHYGLPEGKPALTLGSFSVAAGQTVGLLGKNGAGKSTLLMALSGMIEPSSGEALVDNLMMSHIDPHDLRRDIGIMSQNARLFHGTIRENAMLGAPDAPQTALLNALAVSGADQFIRQLPDGLDHIIDEGGRGLSGGQQQALLLSRLIIRDPNIILLDEPTASLDEAAERDFITRFKTWSKGKTVIVATHRMRMLDVVERAVMLENGRIVLDAPKSDVLTRLRGTPAAAPPPAIEKGAASPATKEPEGRPEKRAKAASAKPRARGKNQMRSVEADI